MERVISYVDDINAHAVTRIRDVDMIVKYGYCYDSMSITRKRIDRRFDTKNVNIHKLMEIMMIVAVFRQMCSAKPIAVKIGCTLFYLNINDEIV